MVRKRLLVYIIAVLVFVSVIGGVSYSYFSYNKKAVNVTLNSGTINLTFTGVTNTLSLDSGTPLSNVMAEYYPGYLEFTVSATVDTAPIYYEINVVPVGTPTIDEKYISVTLANVFEEEGSTVESNHNDPISYSDLPPSEDGTGRTIYNNVFLNSGSEMSRLRVWISEDYDGVVAGNFSYKVYLYARNGEFPTISSCPDCVYVFNVNAGAGTMYTTWNTQSMTPTTLSGTVLTHNYHEVLRDFTTYSKKVFIGVKLNENQQVEKAYACGFYNNYIPFCLEGTNDGSKYNDNKTLLQGANLWNNTCTVGLVNAGQSNEYEDTACTLLTQDYLYDIYNAEARSDGMVLAGSLDHDGKEFFVQVRKDGGFNYSAYVSS